MTVNRAAGAWPKDQLAFGQIGVQRRPGLSGRVAQLRVAGPEVDASVGRLVGIRLTGRPGRPAPGPDGGEPELTCDGSSGKCLELRQLEPLARGPQLLPPSGARRRLEPEHDPQLRGRDPDRDEVLRPAAEHLADRSAALDDAQLVDLRRREVDLANDRGHLGDLAPPVPCLAAGIGDAGDEQDRLRAAGGERAEKDQHIRAVLRVAHAPGRQGARTLQLVLGNHRVGAPHRVRGIRVEPVRAVGDRGRIGGLGRGPGPPREVEVEVDGLRPAGANLRRKDEVRGGIDGACLRKQLPERNRAVGEVDPDRLLGRERAGAARGGLRRGGTCRGTEADDGEQYEQRDFLHATATLSSRKSGSATVAALPL